MMNTITTMETPALGQMHKPVKTVGTKMLTPFLVLTFLLSWGVAALLFLLPDQIIETFGELNTSNPLIILIVYSPGIAGVLMVLLSSGLRGLGSFFRRLTLLRLSLGWWLFLVLGIPAVVFAGAAINGTLNDPFPYSPWTQVLPALALALFLGPIEEFGWRGLALPLLQRRFAPIWAGLVLGLVWAAWHVPAFLSEGMPQNAWSAGPFFLGIVAVSVILTAMFNASRGSLLISILFHFQIMNPLFPDAQPWDNFIYVAIAILVVWLNRRKMLGRDEAVTEVLFSEDTNNSPEQLTT